MNNFFKTQDQKITIVRDGAFERDLIWNFSKDLPLTLSFLEAQMLKTYVAAELASRTAERPGNADQVSTEILRELLTQLEEATEVSQ